MAAEVGQLELAYDYFGETAFIDLRDLAFNTDDGVHLAALAGTWLVAVAGFGGMRDHGDTLASRRGCRPSSPVSASACSTAAGASASTYARTSPSTSCSPASRWRSCTTTMR